MYHIKCSAQLWRGVFVSAFAAFLLTGCQSGKEPPCKITMDPADSTCCGCRTCRRDNARCNCNTSGCSTCRRDRADTACHSH